MKDYQILSLLYQLQFQGDLRQKSVIIAQIKADKTALLPDQAASHTAVAGRVVLKFPNGKTEKVEVLGNGSKKPIII